MQKKVAVIEDEPQMRKNLANILKLENFDPVTADNGTTGLDIIREHHPDLILCDISLPGMDGFDVLKEVRNSPETSQTPFIFLTARDEKVNQRLAMTLGADDYLAKPFAPDDMMRAIDVLLSKQQSWQTQIQDKVDYSSIFVSSVTQDLRSPLAVLLLNLDSLQFDHSKLSDADRQDLMTEMRCQITQLNRMIEDILTYERMEAGTLPRQRIPVDVLDIVRRVIRDTSTIDGGEHLFELHDGPLAQEIHLDPLLTRQIVANLLINASKLSPPNTVIAIKTFSEHRELVIQVVDHGVGISPEEIEQLFHPMLRNKPGTPQQHRTGYSLFIVKSCVEWLGGTLSVQSVLRQGSTFTVRLPTDPD
jgi:two-component system, sensor histidine kinase and response regulator